MGYSPSEYRMSSLKTKAIHGCKVNIRVVIQRCKYLTKCFPFFLGERRDFLRTVGEQSKSARGVYQLHGILSTDHFMGLSLHGFDSTPNRILAKLQEVGRV